MDSFNEKFSGDAVEIDNSGVTALRTALTSLDADCSGAFSAHQLSELTTKCDEIDAQIEVAEVAFQDNPAKIKIANEGKKLIDVLNCGLESFIAGSRCYFIAETWTDAVDVLCLGLIGSIGWIGASQLFLAVMAIPYAITMMFVMKRHGGHGPVKLDGGSNIGDFNENPAGPGMTTVKAVEVHGGKPMPFMVERGREPDFVSN